MFYKLQSKKVLGDSVKVDTLFKEQIISAHENFTGKKYTKKRSTLMDGVSMGYEEFRLLSPVHNGN